MLNISFNHIILRHIYLSILVSVFSALAAICQSRFCYNELLIISLLCHFMKIRKRLIKIGKLFPLQGRLWPRGWVEVWLYSSITAALEGGEWSAARLGLLYPRKDPVPIVQENGWAPGPVWTGGKSRPTGIRSPDRPARNQSLYRLSYPAHT